MKVWWLIAIGILALVGCSASSSQKPAQPAPAQTAAAKSSNPVAKFIELVGFRVNETSPGHLHIQFGVVNHSEADVGDVKLDVSVRTTAAKPGDPPLIVFSTKVASLGPAELKQITVDVPSKMRVYELPDWQFLKADFQIAEP